MTLPTVLASSRPWPDLVDLSAIAIFFGGVLIGILFAYSLMVLDYRAYLRALRGVIMRATYHFPEVPRWTRYETPNCLNELGLRLPCTTADVKQAYRQRAEKLHPDRGGDRRKFMRLQSHFEQSLKFISDLEEEVSAE